MRNNQQVILSITIYCTAPTWSFSAWQTTAPYCMTANWSLSTWKTICHYYIITNRSLSLLHTTCLYCMTHYIPLLLDTLHAFIAWHTIYLYCLTHYMPLLHDTQNALIAWNILYNCTFSTPIGQYAITGSWISVIFLVLQCNMNFHIIIISFIAQSK